MHRAPARTSGRAKAGREPTSTDRRPPVQRDQKPLHTTGSPIPRLPSPAAIPAPRDRPLCRFASLLVLIAVLGAVGAPTALAAAVDEDPRGDHQVRVFEPRHIDVDQLQPTLTLLRLEHRVQPDLGSVVVSAPPERIAAFEKVLAELDRPARPRESLQITVALVEASDAGDPAAKGPGRESRASGALKVLEPALAPLRQRFGYRHFAVAETVLLSVSNHERGAAEGGYESGERSLTYGLALRARLKAPDDPASSAPRRVRIDDLELHLQDYGVPREQRRLRAALQSSFDALSGVPLVVGKVSPVGSEGDLLVLLLAQLGD